MSAISEAPRVNARGDKLSIKTRTDRGGVILATAPSSPLYQSSPAVRRATSAVGAANGRLVAARIATRDAYAAWVAARTAEQAALGEFDAAFDAFVVGAERSAATPEELAGLGLVPVERARYGLVAPTGVVVRYEGEPDQTGGAP
jgi:hypothetical protein